MGAMWNNSNMVEQQALVGQAIEGIWRSMPGQTADVLRLAAIPHWFNEDLLMALAGAQIDWPQILPYLDRLSFIRQDMQGNFRFHAEIRTYLLGWWRQEQLQRYKAANQKALHYFEAALKTDDFMRRSVYEHEVLYHLLSTDEDKGLAYLGSKFEEMCECYQLDLAESFVATASELAAMLTEKGCLWLRYFQARIEFVYHRADSGECTFQDLVEHTSDPILQAIAQWNIGQIRVNQHRWSEAIRIYRISLNSLQNNRAWSYAVRVMATLGHAYVDLAKSSGGFPMAEQDRYSATSRFLHRLQHFPFLLYERLVHRTSFLPNWYFGTNYQDWIIFYLLMEASRWYRQAEKMLQNDYAHRWHYEVQLALADIEHQLGRWSRAQARYAKLFELSDVADSEYRKARVYLGQGQAFLTEEKIAKAIPLLIQAFDIFQHFHDWQSVGITTMLLGHIYTKHRRLDEAMTNYVASAKAFDAVKDDLARTQAIWELEDLVKQPVLQVEQRQEISKIVGQWDERSYISRFPDKLLRWFRRLALLIALPLTYAFSFVVALALSLTFIVIEGEFLLSITGASVGTSITDILILAGAALLPVPLTLWFYRFIYSLLGIVLVHFLGRRLIHVEREQPTYFVTDATGITVFATKAALRRTVIWADVALFASIDYRQWQRQVDLISSSVLVTNPAVEVIVDAITAGYARLKRDIARRLRSEQVGSKQRDLDFTIFNMVWIFTVILISFALALYLVSIGEVPITWSISSTGYEVPLSLSSIMLSFLPTVVLVFPAVVMWRLVYHRIALQNRLGFKVKVIPFWLLVLGAIMCTLTVILWILILLFML